jgi:hypothetical protein
MEKIFMKSIYLRFVALIAALMLSACAAPVLKKEQADSLKAIGVVSLLPDQMAYQKIGITVFNNEFVNKPIGDLLNLSAQTSASAEITKFSGKTAKVLSVDTKALARRYRSGSIVMSYDVERIKGDLVDLAKQNNLDAIVVIAERFDSENGVGGVRAFFLAGLGDIRSASIQTGMTISVVDAKGVIVGLTNSGGRYAASRSITRTGGAWAYKLEDNLDQATQDYVLKNMQSAIAAEVASGLLRVGF